MRIQDIDAETIERWENDLAIKEQALSWSNPTRSQIAPELAHVIYAAREALEFHGAVAAFNDRAEELARQVAEGYAEVSEDTLEFAAKLLDGTQWAYELANLMDCWSDPSEVLVNLTDDTWDYLAEFDYGSLDYSTGKGVRFGWQGSQRCLVGWAVQSSLLDDDYTEVEVRRSLEAV